MPRQDKSVVENRPLENFIIDHGCQGGSTSSFFLLLPTQKLVSIGHMSIANILVYVSGLYGVLFR